MASTSGVSNSVLILPILIFIMAIINAVIVSAVREGELNIVFGVMRARGYHLFANAIATSDVHYDIKSDSNFTLFAPINSALFAIDMTLAATNYVSTLRYHVVPRLLSIPDLLSLPPGANSVPTLMPGHNILVEQRRSPRSLITVGGVNIVVPGMYYGRDIIVHGLDGVLDLRSHSRYSPENVTGASLTNLSGNLTFLSPITDLSNNQTSMNDYPNADMPPLNSTQVPLPPPVFDITGNYSFEFPVDVQSPLSSNLTQNQTVTYPVVAPSTSPGPSSDLSPLAHGIAVHLTPRPSPNQSPTHSTSFPLTGEEHMSRAKLLELTSFGTQDLSVATEPTSNRLQQFTPVDDKPVDCSLAYNDRDVHNAAIHARKLYIASTMICAQK